MKLYATKEKAGGHEYVIVDAGSPADEYWRGRGYLPKDSPDEEVGTEVEDSESESSSVDLADLHWRQAVERVEAAETADEVRSLLEAENAGSGRKSVIQAAETRLEELGE